MTIIPLEINDLDEGDMNFLVTGTLQVDGTITYKGQPLPKVTRGAIGSGPPGSPSDGDIWIAETAVEGITWTFIYNAGSGSANKWEFIGGAPMYAEILSTETTSSGSYVALSTPGPSVAIPRAGDYDVEIGALLGNGTDLAEAWMSYDVGAVGALDVDGLRSVESGGSGPHYQALARSRRKTGLTAVTLTAKYKRAVAGTASFGDRWMKVLPVRIQ